MDFPGPPRHHCNVTTPPHISPGSTNNDPTHLQLGTQFTFDVHLDPSEPSSAPPGQAIALEVSVLEPIIPDNDDNGRKGWRIAWKQRASVFQPGWVLRSERVQEFVEDGEGGTEYECYETFYGVLAPVVRMAVSGRWRGV
ncbi:hypothetical protein N0V88_003709 [Collariella sp. IMI 366227]|nr:hypothetical protein N0V88_003709 [Collariella sp. IMI 366227]